MPQHRYGTELLNLIYILFIYSTISPLYSFFCLTVHTPLFSAEGTREDAADNLDRVETFVKCLQQVGPKGVWLRFNNVERILGMHTGDFQAMWSDIRPKCNCYVYLEGLTEVRTIDERVENVKACLGFVPQ